MASPGSAPVRRGTGVRFGSASRAAAASGNIGSVPGLTVVGLTDASSTVATVSLTPDPRLGA